MSRIFSWLNGFLIGFFFLFKKSCLQHFNKKAVVKICRISHPKGLPWNLAKFRREVFLVDVSKTVCWILWFWLRINSKIVKTHAVYENSHLHICSICFKTRCFFVNRNSVFPDWTKWKENTYQWKYDT